MSIDPRNIAPLKKILLILFSMMIVRGNIPWGSLLAEHWAEEKFEEGAEPGVFITFEQGSYTRIDEHEIMVHGCVYDIVSEHNGTITALADLNETEILKQRADQKNASALQKCSDQYAVYLLPESAAYSIWDIFNSIFSIQFQGNLSDFITYLKRPPRAESIFYPSIKIDQAHVQKNHHSDASGNRYSFKYCTRDQAFGLYQRYQS